MSSLRDWIATCREGTAHTLAPNLSRSMLVTSAGVRPHCRKGQCCRIRPCQNLHTRPL